MKRRLLLIVAFLLPASLLLAQTVDRDEFSDTLATTINFINFSGPYDRIDSAQQISAIGSALSRGLQRTKESSATYAERYKIIHVLGSPEEKGKAADILFFLKGSQVDHIDNVRRIISAYLSSMYGYAKADADILAFFVTIYNAVHRGNLGFFQGRYKASVMKYLSAVDVGIAIRYSEWPGKTQIVIPLSLSASKNGPPSLSAVSAAALISPEVIETVRDKPKSGTDERQKLATLMDKTVDEEQNAIDKRKAELDAEIAKNRERQNQLDAEKKASSTSSTTIPADSSTSAQASARSATTATTTTTVRPESVRVAEEEKLKQEEAQLAAEKKQLDERQEEVKSLSDATKTLREATAADLKNQGKESATLTIPVVVLKARLEKGLIVSQAQKIVPASSEVLANSSSNSLLGRTIFAFGENWLALDGTEAAASLVLLSDKDLSLVKKGTTPISPWSQLIPLSGGKECLAIVQDSGEWYLGRFDLQLNAIARSAIPVDPVGAIVVQGGAVFVQRKDGRISQLNLQDLRIGK